jgi:hypothetical protein
LGVTSRKVTGSRSINVTVTAISSAILVALWLSRWPLRSRFPYEWDSASYILGAGTFDVYLHHPHPPGYPLYILLLKGMRFLTPDLNAAQVVVAFAFTGAATMVMYRFGQRCFRAPAALFASTLLLFSPPVILYNAIASTYPVDLLTSVLVASLAARLWTGEASVGPWAVFAFSVLAGFRESGALLMAPLLGVALVRALRTDVVRWGQTVAIGAGTAATWYLPTAWMHGGVFAYQRLCNATIHGYFAQLSVLYGAPKAMHLAMLVNAARWSVMVVALATIVTAAVWCVGRAWTETPFPLGWRSDPPIPNAAAFFALWMVPNAAYVTLLQCVKPGYLGLSIPPVMLFLAGAVAPSFSAIASRLRLSAGAIAAATACAFGMASMAVACHHFRNASFQRASLASAWDGDEETRAMRSLIEGGAGGADHTMAVFLSWPWYGPTPQSMMLQYPNSAIAIVTRGALSIHRHGAEIDERGDLRPIPADVQKLLWVCEVDYHLPAPVFSEFPETHEVYVGRKTAVFLTQLPERSAHDGDVARVPVPLE